MIAVAFTENNCTRYLVRLCNLINSIMNVIRWIAFIPCAIVAYVICFVLWYLVTKFSIGYFVYRIEDGGLVSNVLRLIANIPSVYFGVLFGVYIVPENKKIAERIILVIFILMAILSILVGNSYYTNSTMSIISSVVIIVTSCFLLFYNSNKQDDETV